MWSIEQAIKHYEVLASRLDDICMKPASEYPKQTAEWLRELVWRRKLPEIIYCMFCANRVWNTDTCKFHCGLSGSIKTDYEFCSDGKRKEGKNE